ncbi:MAG: hypothetical protein NT004_17735 [Bacteroidetes bacterium]|nr:hypothetical protein [Bacteroidota bacterium]
MNHQNYRFIILILSLPGLLFLHSCLPEQKVAKTFIQSQQVMNLLINPPEMVYKYNHKGEAIEGFDSMNPARQDSALWETSRYIQFLSDSIILENYMNNFIDELRLLGFNVFLGSAADSFVSSKPQSYTLDIAQVQIDEYLYPQEDEIEFFDSVFYKRVNLNAVDFSCWFDLRKANVENPRTTVLYSTSTSYDSFDGRFFTDPFTGKIRYRYSIDSLALNDVYTMAAYLGKKHAGYLYDFFLNQYIAKNLPEGLEMTDYFHFNKKRETIVSAYDERFEILGTK